MKWISRLIRGNTHGVRVVLATVVLIAQGCGAKDIDSENGRMSMVAQANMFLNSGMCDQAIDVLKPLYESRHADNEVRMVYASAYACKAEFSFPSVLTAMKDPGSDIYATLVKSMYSTGADNHLVNFQRAAQLIRETASVSGSFDASVRSADANVYMIFMQTGALSSVLSDLGAANRTTGKKTQSATTRACTTAECCAVQVAYATISDSLNYIGDASIFGSLKDSITSICTAGACSNKSPDACVNDSTSTLPTAGQALINAIDLQWQF